MAIFIQIGTITMDIAPCNHILTMGIAPSNHILTCHGT
jgi:hypothetical protein